ncbi:hypothetical protein [Thauera sp. SWB20]|uniref:hypothetical protein n=1 Tax=Thauera sp. SWB20 TaxID=1572758 RepID=UPI0012E0A3E7|nr:hypothetical protein [Thauera sp. SWB20]
MSDNTPASSSPPPAPTSPGESVAAPAEVGQVGGTSLDLQKLRRQCLVIFLVAGFLAPVLLSSVFVIGSALVAFIDARFSDYSGAIYGWFLWLIFCLVSTLKVYWEDKREMGA